MDRKLYTYETLKFDFLKDNKKKKKSKYREKPSQHIYDDGFILVF